MFPESNGGSRAPVGIAAAALTSGPGASGPNLVLGGAVSDMVSPALPPPNIYTPEPQPNSGQVHPRASAEDLRILNQLAGEGHALKVIDHSINAMSKPSVAETLRAASAKGGPVDLGGPQATVPYRNGLPQTKPDFIVLKPRNLGSNVHLNFEQR